MDKKGQLGVGGIVVLAMGIIVALVLSQQIFNQQSIMTSKISVEDELIDISPARLSGGAINETYPFTVTNYPSGWKVTECPLTGVTYGNASTDFTSTTDYTFNTSSGVLLLKNTATVNQSSNSTYIDYTYCPDGYNKDSSSRSIAGLIGLFAALGLVAWVISTGVRNWI